jgi:cold shock CspA family protein
MTGTISDLRPGGFGYIASDALTLPTKLQFRRIAVDNGAFDQLRIGQRVSFDRVLVPGNAARYHAVHVAAYNDRNDAYEGGPHAFLAVETQR